MHRLPQLQLRLSELRRMHAEYAAQASRQTMAHYIATLIADAEDEITRIERRSAEAGPSSASE